MPLLHAFLSHGWDWQGGWFVGGCAVDGHPRKWHHLFIEHSIRLLSSMWYMCIFAIICTLRPCWGCTLSPQNSLHGRGGVSIYVAVCSNLSGCALICTCAVSAICCRSFVAGECLSLPVMPWMLALTQSANACISLSACVMEGLVMHLCWNCTVLNRHLLLATVFW